MTFALVSVEGDLNSVEVAQAPAVPTARPQPTARPRPAATPPAAPQPTSPPAPPPVAPKHVDARARQRRRPRRSAARRYFKGMSSTRTARRRTASASCCDRYGPRQIKYSGSAGSNGNWGFTPCGQENCGQIKIYVVSVPARRRCAGLSVGPLAWRSPRRRSDVFEVNVTDKCAAGPVREHRFPEYAAVAAASPD